METVDPLRDDPDDGVTAENAMIGAEFGDDHFQSRRVRPRMTRAQKRANKRNYCGEWPHSQLGSFGEVSLIRARGGGAVSRGPHSGCGENVIREGSPNCGALLLQA